MGKAPTAMVSLNVSLPFHCVSCRKQPLPGRRHPLMWFHNLHENPLTAMVIRPCHQRYRDSSVRVPPIQKSAHLSHLDCDPQQLRRSEIMPHLPWKEFFPSLQSVFFTDLQQKQSCDSRREFISINGVQVWGKTNSFVTWEFWGVPLSQDQYSWSHKFLCHAALPSTKTCIFFFLSGLLSPYLRIFYKSYPFLSKQTTNGVMVLEKGE